MDPELREALNQVVVDLRDEIRSGDAATREALNQLAVDLRDEIRSGDAATREALNQLAVDLRGEIRLGDAETREALDRFAADLRGEIRSVDATFRGALNELAVDLRGEIQTSAAGFLHQMRESESGTRRHFDVVGESLRSDIRAITEGMAASREQTERRLGEQAGRTDGLEGRVLRLEVRVTGLEDGRKVRRPRRRR